MIFGNAKVTVIKSKRKTISIQINIIRHLTDISNLARLPWQGGVALVAISMGLTMIAGLIPSRLAAKKDPVEALRSE